ncbi:MAG: HAMP domain-containing histidine kinase [Anaerolineales bacterium]|nr:HAMP domain-containing histidine kinase [Anaerolineales bacterium]
MFRSLQSRLFLTYLLVAGLVLLFVAVSLLFFLLRSTYGDQRVYLTLERSLPVLARGQGVRLLELEGEELISAVERMDEISSVRVIIVNPQGEVLADSRSTESLVPNEVLQKSGEGQEIVHGRFGTPGEGIWLYISQSLGQRFRIILASPRPTLLNLRLWWDSVLRPILQAAGIALFLSIFLSWLMSRWVAAPLDRMAEVSRAVAGGDYDQRLQPGGPQEVRGLALTFNEMVERVQAGRKAQRDFVANVSHELKTPLTSIQGFAQAILDGTAQDHDSQQHAAQVVFDEAQRLHRLVEDLLELARMDAGQIDFHQDRVDIMVLLSAVVERLSVKASEARVKVINKVGQLPVIIGDGDRLAQVFMNLIDNAIKHTPEGGQVSLWGEYADGWISIHVEDSGSGIPEDELSRIFERFYQLDKARPGGMDRGVGLGLAITREIVRSHQGRLVAQSVLGRGSRFTVQLPVVRADDATLAIDRG